MRQFCDQSVCGKALLKAIFVAATLFNATATQVLAQSDPVGTNYPIDYECPLTPAFEFDEFLPVLPEPIAGFDPNSDCSLETPCTMSQPVLAMTRADANGDIGNFHFLHVINGLPTRFTVFDKQGNQLTPTIGVDTLGDPAQGFETLCNNPFTFDGTALYDEPADRWVISSMRWLGNDSKLCVSVSKGHDPITGGWRTYEFDFGSGFRVDYPKVAVAGEDYIVAGIMHPDGMGGAVRSVVALERQKMLTGQPARCQNANVPRGMTFTTEALAPVDIAGPDPVPGHGLAIRQVDDEILSPTPDSQFDQLEIFEFATDWDDFTESQFVLAARINVEEFSLAFSDCPNATGNTDRCVPQQDAEPLRALPGHPMWSPTVRRMQGYDAMVLNFVSRTGTAISPSSDERWYELRRLDGGDWSLFREGALAPTGSSVPEGGLDDTSVLLGSIAMDRAGNISMGATVTSSQRPPGTIITAPVSESPAQITELADGFTSSPTGYLNDYTSLRVDPVDGCTFWHSNIAIGMSQTPENPPISDWVSTIAKFRLDNCIDDPDPDRDGIDTTSDNCSLAPNASQIDTDGDNFGNACDADFNNDCLVNVVDLGLFKINFFSTSALYDLNGDGLVNVIDLGLLRTLFFQIPGPSGIEPECVPDAASKAATAR